ncbi:DUF2920 family protein [Lentibacillus saliphilus]|uniref:DUF2920 family protein n=1 Tax=Lentibacillus saliphilus TaxID=2737028 RepID=UPI001C30C24E|nr:DUF2920 family protein [Lentibacillus saliphilus]
MAESHELTIPAHFNIYTGKQYNRDLNVYFSVPNQGVNHETGLLLLISGFGAKAQSNVYRKMREQFADHHNLVTIQCDYFGCEYMQAANNIQVKNSDALEKIMSKEDYESLRPNMNRAQDLLACLSDYECIVGAVEQLNESEASFNDMGFMQALDLLSALYAVKIILRDNEFVYNEDRVIAYGHSHGAFLAYLCNRMAPYDFSLIIDNSAWLKPGYFYASRYVNQQKGNVLLQTEFNYLARQINYDKELLSLPKLYKGFENNTLIIAYQGVADALVNYKEKERFCNSVDHCIFNLIDEEAIDYEMFYSTNHGLKADFIKLFDDIMNKQYLKSLHNHSCSRDSNIEIHYNNRIYSISYDRGLPVMGIK